MTVRSNSLKDIIKESNYFFKPPNVFFDTNLEKIWDQKAHGDIKEIIKLYSALNSWGQVDIEKIFKDYIKNKNYGIGRLMKPMRIALCGSLTGPSLFELMRLLGKQETINRLDYALNQIELSE